MFVKRRAEWDASLTRSLFVGLQTFAGIVYSAGEAIHIVAVLRRLQWI